MGVLKGITLVVVGVGVSIINALGQQKVRHIKFDDPLEICGVLFKNGDDVHVENQQFKQFFIPSNEELYSAESTMNNKLVEKLKLDYQTYSDRGILSKKEKKEWERTISNTNYFEKYCNYKRQYAGFKNTNGDRLIAIYLMDFSKKSYRENYFSSWETEMIVGLGVFYDKHSSFFIINLDNNSIIR